MPLATLNSGKMEIVGSHASWRDAKDESSQREWKIEIEQNTGDRKKGNEEAGESDKV